MNEKNEFLPIFIEKDFRQAGMMEEVSSTTSTMLLNFNFSPINIGQLRILLHFERAMRLLRQLGYSKKEEDELKYFLLDNNVYLLCGLIFVGGIHVSNASLTIEKRTILSLNYVSGSIEILVV